MAVFCALDGVFIMFFVVKPLNLRSPKPPRDVCAPIGPCDCLRERKLSPSDPDDRNLVILRTNHWIIFLASSEYFWANCYAFVLASGSPLLSGFALT